VAHVGGETPVPLDPSGQLVHHVVEGGRQTGQIWVRGRCQPGREVAGGDPLGGVRDGGQRAQTVPGRVPAEGGPGAGHHDRHGGQRQRENLEGLLQLTQGGQLVVAGAVGQWHPDEQRQLPSQLDPLHSGLSGPDPVVQCRRYARRRRLGGTPVPGAVEV